MLKIKYTDFLNEEMAGLSNKKLRDSIHDIIVNLEPKKIIDIEELSNILINEYKINISPYFLDKFLDEFLKMKAKNKKNNSIFIDKDVKWLGVRDVNGNKQVRNNLHFQKPALTKHKRRLEAMNNDQKLEEIYKKGMPDLNFKEEIVRKSLINQNSTDYKEIMKFIYNSIILNKRYSNSYDNCWKLMMLMGRTNKLDRMRGWFKLAPESVKTEYARTQKVNYELTPLKR